MASQRTRRIAINAVLVISTAALGMFALVLPDATVAGKADMWEVRAPDPYPLEHRYNVVKAVQTALLEKGYDPGPIDGLYGPRTRSALYAYQKDNGLSGDGHLTEQTVEHLGLR